MNDLRLVMANCKLLMRRSRAFGLFVAAAVASVLLIGGVVAQAAQAVQHQVLDSGIMRTIEVDSHGVAEPIPLTHRRIAELAGIPGVTSVRPWIQSGCLVTEAPLAVPGALWSTPYAPVGQPPVTASVRRPLPPLGDGEVILPAQVQGADMAALVGQQIKLEYTQRLTVNTGEPRYVKLQVVGLYDQTVGGRDGPTAIYVSQATALLMAAAREGVKPEAFGRDIGYPRVIVEVDSANKVRDVQRQISALGYNASSVQSQLDELPPAMQLIDTLGDAMAVVLMVICILAGLSIGAGLVAARLREIGVLKAIGFTNGRVAKLLGFELGLFGLLAGLVGAIIGTVSLVLLQLQLGGKTLMSVPLADGVALPGLTTILLAALAPAVAMLVGGVLPMIKAAGLPPDLAMRDVV